MFNQVKIFCFSNLEKHKIAKKQHVFSHRFYQKSRKNRPKIRSPQAHPKKPSTSSTFFDNFGAPKMHFCCAKLSKNAFLRRQVVKKTGSPTFFAMLWKREFPITARSRNRHCHSKRRLPKITYLRQLAQKGSRKRPRKKKQKCAVFEERHTHAHRKIARKGSHRAGP